ncbi:MAG: FAD:protein FMN transferase [Verrucomicrobiota bacterium]
MNNPSQFPEALHFSHEAMNTTFELWLRGVDPGDAPGIARECYEKIDLIEGRLSRFIDTSDISRINQLSAGETLYISQECHECLLLGLEAHTLSCGLFDITLGTRIQHLKSGDETTIPPLTGRWIIHPDVPAVTCVDPGRELDLGGIGKGFTLDQLRNLLIDWEVDDALLAAGASSLLAHGPTNWPVELAGSNQSQRINLTNQALSASGTLFQGSHIVHPAGQDAMPDHAPTRVWVTAATAALAEIWSTTLMLMSQEEIPDFIADNPEITSVHAEYDGRLEKIR